MRYLAGRYEVEMGYVAATHLDEIWEKRAAQLELDIELWFTFWLKVDRDTYTNL